jgi:hypothetical protein
MITTRGWGGAGGLITALGFGGYLVGVELVRTPLSVSPELQGVLQHLRVCVLAKTSVDGLQNRLGEAASEVVLLESEVLSLETRLQALEADASGTTRVGSIPAFSVGLDCEIRGKISSENATLRTQTGAAQIGAQEQVLEGLLADLRRLEQNLRIYRRQRRTP